MSFVSSVISILWYGGSVFHVEHLDGSEEGGDGVLQFFHAEVPQVAFRRLCLDHVLAESMILLHVAGERRGIS